MGEALIFALPWVLAGLTAVTVLVLLRRPLRQLGVLLLKLIGSLTALAVLGPAGTLIGVTLGANLVNALVIALLGVPGVGLLLLLNWMLGT